MGIQGLFQVQYKLLVTDYTIYMYLKCFFVLCTRKGYENLKNALQSGKKRKTCFEQTRDVLLLYTLNDYIGKA